MKYIVIGIVMFAVIAGVAYVLNRDRGDDLIACTLEARMCPDGSAVGRTGPKCEFAACPGEAPQY